MSEQDNQESHPPQPTKDNRADYFKDIASFAKEEINYVRSAYKWLISLIAIVAIVGIAFTYTTISDFKKEAREEVKRRIDEEFKSDNIHNLVEKKAGEHIDRIADKLIEQKISDKISPQIKAVEQQLQKIQADFKITENNISELNAVSDFAMTVIAAQNDDRKAFDKLRSWSKDRKFPRYSEAEQAWIRVMNEHASPFEYTFTVPWREGIDPAKLSFAELESNFESAPSLIKVGLLEYIWKRQDIPKR